MVQSKDKVTYRNLAPAVATPFLLVLFFAETLTASYDECFVSSLTVVILGCILYRDKRKLGLVGRHRLSRCSYLGNVSVIRYWLHLGGINPPKTFISLTAKFCVVALDATSGHSLGLLLSNCHCRSCYDGGPIPIRPTLFCSLDPI